VEELFAVDCHLERPFYRKRRGPCRGLFTSESDRFSRSP
jgi:hypothetical protein